MTMWLPSIEDRNGPRYQAIAEAIGDAVTGGDLAPGDQLPPQRELAWQLGVTVGTVSRAYMLAEQKGLLSGEVGRGTFVRDAKKQAGARMLPPVGNVAVDLGLNMAYGPEQGAALAETLAELSRRNELENLLPYMPLGGHPEHRAAAATWIARRGFEVAPDRVIATCGAQHGLAVALSALAEPGAAVLVEALTYAGVVDTARFVGRRVEAVAIDDDGMVPEALDRAVRTTGARVAVLVPTIHNPTAAIMSEARRRAIVEVARARDLFLVEDDVYSLLPEDPPPPLAALAPERTVYLTSASKTLAPGLRVGWAVAPPELVQLLAERVFASTVAQPALTHEIIRRWIEDGTADALLAGLRAELVARQDIVREVLDGEGERLRGHPSSYHVLLDLPVTWTAAGFVDAALSRGIRIAPAAIFAVGRGPVPNAVRISVAPAATDRTALRRALETLRDLLRGGHGQSRTIV